MTRQERNEMILVLVKTRSYSYEVIAQMMHCSRNAVAGVVFRERHPATARILGPNKNARNIIGTGHRAPTYRAATNKRDLLKTERRT